MACFIVSAAEAVVVTAIEKVQEKKELKNAGSVSLDTAKVKIPLSQKLKWLSGMLWGGSALLAFEHIWHGEVVLWFPFLTAMENPTDMMEMFHEMATVGVCMAVLVTAFWAVICIVADLITGREPKKTAAQKKGEQS